MSAEPVHTDSHDIPDGCVLVSIVGGVLDETCVAWAAAAAQRTNRPLHLIHAREDDDGGARRDIFGGSGPKGDPRLDRELAAAQERWPDLTVSGTSLPGKRERVLVESSDRAYMIVTGAPKRSGFERLLERPSLAAAMHSSCPVVIVPQGVRPEPDGPVIAAIDGSDHSKFALRRAFTVARTRGDRLVVVTTWSVEVMGGLVFTEPGTASWENLENGYRSMCQDMVNELTGEFPEVEYEIRVMHGHPARVITGLSDEAGLLVLGTRGRGGFRGMMLGSTTHEVIETATCPVLVARQSDKG